MSIFSDWPEIAPVLPATPATEELPVLHVEHAVWGKAHGARSDFRWIARSPGFPNDSDLPRQLNFGAEDQPARTQLWRNLNGRCYAVSCYPSRAADASGRGGFLEKQVLAWEPAGLPAALGALLLLPRVARLTDEVWWDRCEGQPWTDQGFALPLPVPKRIPIEEAEVEETGARGIEALHATLQAGALEAFFLRLLGRSRPAGLTGLAQPLPVEALAALLLPLPGLLADRISLAGWISGHASREELARWDAVVLPPGTAGTAESEVRVSPADRERASAWARKLLLIPEPMKEELSPPSFAAQEAGHPSHPEAQVAKPSKSRHPSPFEGLPNRTIDLDLPGDASPLLRELHAFACSVDRRWINPETLCKTVQYSKPASASLLPSWIETLAAERPEDVDEDQWTVKLELLWSAAIVLCPEPAFWKKVRLPQGKRIPLLFFTLFFESTKPHDTLGNLGEAPLLQIIEQSLDCVPSRWVRKVQDRIDLWHGNTGRTDVRRSIETAKKIRAQRVS